MNAAEYPFQSTGVYVDAGDQVEMTVQDEDAIWYCSHYMGDGPEADLVSAAGALRRSSEDAACERALYFGDPAYRTVKRILSEGLENQLLPIAVTLPAATTFMRSADELVQHLFGGESWS